MTDVIPGTLTEAGTIDSPATAELSAGHYINPGGADTPPSLVVDVDFGDLGVDDCWTFDSVVSIEGSGVVVFRFVPQGSDEGWARLDEVGEW